MSHPAPENSRHPSSVRTYALCLLALLVLSLAALGGAFVQLGAFAIPVALALAAVKTLLVAGFFMHMIEQPSSHRIAALSGLLLLLILIALACADVATRS